MKRGLTTCAALGLLAACAADTRLYSSENELAEVQAVVKRDFHARGSAGMDRVDADALQRACNLHENNPPEAVAKPLEEAQFKAIPFPTGNLIGDWKSGQRIAQSGRGMQWTDKAGEAGGGSCYNCHQLSPQEVSHGTIGPSLLGYGKIRGTSTDMQRYTWGRIYNSKAYSLCSQMPRLGHSKTLSEQQIKDLVGYLLDPQSPVNR